MSIIVSTITGNTSLPCSMVSDKCQCDQQRLASEVVLLIYFIINSTKAFISYDSSLQVL